MSGLEQSAGTSGRSCPPGTHVPTGADHFGHREAEGVVVHLFWRHCDLGDEFRVEVEDRRNGVHFELRPTTGKEAIQAFYHPFAATERVLRAEPGVA